MEVPDSNPEQFFLFFFLFLGDCSIRVFNFTCLVIALHPLASTLSAFKSQKVCTVMVNLSAYRVLMFLSVVYPEGMTKN